MKKVLLVSDGEDFPQHAFDYACRINEWEPILLTGLFLPPINYMFSLTETGSIAAGLPLVDDYSDVATVGQTVKQFKAACSRKGIECRVHSERTSAGSISNDIRLESRFADLIVMENVANGSYSASEVKDEELTMVLRYAECPVVIATREHQPPDKVVIAYDGSASCMRSIKEFIHCFPQYTALDTEIVFVHRDEDQYYPAIEYLKEFAGRHFTNPTFTRLDIDARAYFDTWLMEQKNAILVTGSGGRSLISQFLKQSFVDSVIEDRQVTVFTAHK